MAVSTAIFRSEKSQVEEGARRDSGASNASTPSGQRAHHFIGSARCSTSKLAAMRSTWLLLATCAACGFEGSEPSNGLPPDVAEVAFNSAEELSADFSSTESADVYVSAAGTVEPTAWLPGKLLTEIDEGDGPFNGTWAIKPMREQLANIGLMHPSNPGNQKPPGAPGTNYILWYSGEIRLDQGPQKIAVATGTGSDAFAEILRADGTTLLRCDEEMLECSFSAPVAGWYRVRIGWHRLQAAITSAFELQWLAAAIGVPTRIAPDRLRVRASDTMLNGWRMEAYEDPRLLIPIANGAALNHKEPFSMTWAPSLLGRDNGSPGYRNVGQLRLLEEGSYDFSITAGPETSFRLWLDGEWVSKPENWNPLPGQEHSETITRTLKAGWHDVALEAYENGGTSNEVKLEFGRTGGALAPPKAADARTLLSGETAVQSALNNNPVQLVRNTVVTQTVSVPAVAGGNPNAAAVDLSLRLQPKVWQGLEIQLRPPGSATSIPLTINVAGLTNDTDGEVLASLNKAALGAMPVSGAWAIEVKHPDAGTGFTGDNSIKSARLNVRYTGDATIGAPAKQITESSRYVRMISLPEARELRELLSTSITPTGSSIELYAKVCQDAAGTDCGADLTSEALESSKPTARYVKVTALFTSDGFATPILDRIALRYQK